METTSAPDRPAASKATAPLPLAVGPASTRTPGPALSAKAARLGSEPGGRTQHRLHRGGRRRDRGADAGGFEDRLPRTRLDEAVKEAALGAVEVRLDDEELLEVRAERAQDPQRFDGTLGVHHLEGLVEEDELALARARGDEGLGEGQAQGQGQGLAGPAAQLMRRQEVALL